MRREGGEGGRGERGARARRRGMVTATFFAVARKREKMKDRIGLKRENVVCPNSYWGNACLDWGRCAGASLPLMRWTLTSIRIE